jgi:hypothetical protein
VIKPLQAKRVRVSMVGRGRWIDNVFVERLTTSHFSVWRTGATSCFRVAPRAAGSPPVLTSWNRK